MSISYTSKRAPLAVAVAFGLAALLASASAPLARADVPPSPRPSPAGVGAGAGNGPSPQAPPSPSAEAADGASVSARILAGITQVGSGSATIRRSARDLLLANLMVFARSMRAVPANAGDGVIGFRLFSIRAGSIAAALGLRNGDLLRSINGRPTTTPQEALAAYTGLRGADSWSLRVNRRGRDVMLSVQVVDDATSAPTTNGGGPGATNAVPASAP